MSPLYKPKSGALVQYEGDLFTTGEEIYSRRFSNSAPSMTSQILRLAFFTARKTATYTQVKTCTSSTAAAATPTLCKMAVFSVAANGDLTCIAVTANDTALWAATNTEYTRATTASYNIVAGQRYALGALCVTGATPPTLTGSGPGVVGTTAARAPMLVAVVNPSADMPAVAGTIAAGSLGTSASSIYGELVP